MVRPKNTEPNGNIPSGPLSYGSYIVPRDMSKTTGGPVFPDPVILQPHLPALGHGVRHWSSVRRNGDASAAHLGYPLQLGAPVYHKSTPGKHRSAQQQSTQQQSAQPQSDQRVSGLESSVAKVTKFTSDPDMNDMLILTKIITTRCTEPICTFTWSIHRKSKISFL
jgi:hypothetical protein